VLLLDGQPLDLGALGVAGWHHHVEVPSTMDTAHALAAAGAPGWTVVLADGQHAGRGRTGKAWHSAPGGGVWCTVLARDVPADALGVLSLRVGLALAGALAPLADLPLWLKWPNDVLAAPAVHDRPDWTRLGKLAGVLVEARWRETRVEWVAIGVGVNLHRPDDVAGGWAPAALRPGTSRAAVLGALLPAVRGALGGRGPLAPDELAAWQLRDACAGRRCVAPVAGIVAGVAADGMLRVHGTAGEQRCSSGSLELVE
jgi:BirA family biotin operon repressor/biotin-[acetyl-CoA-carboxylase] ligase